MSRFDGMKAEFGAVPAHHKPAGIQVADTIGISGWASDISTRQLIKPDTAVTTPAGTVVTGASGWDNRSGAYGWRPVLRP